MSDDSKDTLVDKHLRRIKNRPILAILIVVAICISAIGGFTSFLLDGVSKLSGLRTSAKPDSAKHEPASEPRSETANLRPNPQPAATESPKTEPARERIQAANDEKLFVQCVLGTMPSVLPAEGRIRVLVLSPQELAVGGGGFGDYFGFGKPGGDMKWSDKAPAWAYRCEVTNYSKSVLLNVRIPVRLTFREPERVAGQTNSRKEGAITLDRGWDVSIPKIDPSPASPFIFYVWNCCVPRFVHIGLPAFVMNQGRKIALIQSDGNLFQSLNPEPWPTDGP